MFTYFIMNVIFNESNIRFILLHSGYHFNIHLESGEKDCITEDIAVHQALVDIQSSNESCKGT